MKKRNDILTTVSFTLLLLVTVTAGYLLSQDQTFSPAASVSGYITTGLAELIAGLFVAYALYRKRALTIKNNYTPSLMMNSVVIGLAYGTFGFFVAVALRFAFLNLS